MAEGGDDRYIHRIFIGERLNKEYPREAEGDDHILYFYFHLEVIAINDQGGRLHSKEMFLSPLTLTSSFLETCFNGVAL